MKRIMMAAVLLAASLAAAPAALAQARTGYAAVNANLRAGPDSGYPRIGAVPAGAALDIYGCIDDWSWCDVQWRGERGWISAGLIEYDYSGRRVAVYDYGARIGLPILAFSLDAYWGSHYRGRSWYRERDRWHDHRPSPKPVARPKARPAPSPRREEPARGQQRPQAGPQRQQPRQQPQQQRPPQQQSRPPPQQAGRPEQQGRQGQQKPQQKPAHRKDDDRRQEDHP